MCEFSKPDVLTLAKAILEDPVEYCENTNYLGSIPEYYCRYCEAKDFNREGFRHEPSCPVLIAQDIMTRN